MSSVKVSFNQNNGQNDTVYARSRFLRVNATVRPISQVLFASFSNLRAGQPKTDADTQPDPLFTRRDWPQNWTLEELARLQTMWKEGKTVAEMHRNGFQNRSLAIVRELLRVVFSRNTGKEARLRKLQRAKQKKSSVG